VLALPQRSSSPLQLHLLEEQTWLEPNGLGHWLDIPVGQVHSPEVIPLAVWGTQEPLEQVTPHWPQLVASLARSLQRVPQQMAPGWAPLHARWLQLGSAQSMPLVPPLSMPSAQLLSQFAPPRQLGSWQSMSPSQSLSMPSVQLTSVAGVGVTPWQAQVVPLQVNRLLVPEQLRPAQFVSAQSMKVSQSLSSPSLQLNSLVCPPAQHAPLLQLLPLAQVAEVPHLQPPPVQLSARVELQLVQVPPSAPQLLVEVPDEQVLPLQQPEQLVLSQTQLPDAQCCPAEQALLVPQRQFPPEEQLFAVMAEQVVQLLALAPHAASVAGVMQVPLLQQPEAQLVTSHTQAPETQC